MAITTNSWHLNSYTNATWTDWVAPSGAVAVVKTAVLTNTSSSSTTVSIRVVDAASAVQSTLVHAATIPAGAAFSLDISMLSVPSGNKVQINAAVAGLSFTASGLLK